MTKKESNKKYYIKNKKKQRLNYEKSNLKAFYLRRKKNESNKTSKTDR